jgi:hypothetical protein
LATGERRLIRQKSSGFERMGPFEVPSIEEIHGLVRTQQG